MFLLSSGRPMELLFGEALPLLADAIRLQAIHLRADPDRGAQSQPLAGLAAGRWQRKEVPTTQLSIARQENFTRVWRTNDQPVLRVMLPVYVLSPPL